MALSLKALLVALALGCGGAAHRVLHQQDDLHKHDEWPVVKFGLISDVHYADAEAGGAKVDYRAGLASLKEAMIQFHDESVHFGISLGDLVDFAANRTATGSEAALKAAMATLLGLHRAWYFVVGEHDAMSFPYSQLVDLYEVEIRGLLPRHARAVYYTMSPAKGIRLIALDFADAGLFGRDPSDPALHDAQEFFRSVNPNADDPVKRDDPALLGAGTGRRFLARNGAVSRVQLAWLGHTLHEAENDNERVIILSHPPILPESASEACGGACLGWNYAEVLDVLRPFNTTVAAVLSGHDHAGGYARDPETGIHFVGSIVAADPAESSYAVVEVYSDRIEVKGMGKMARESRTLALAPVTELSEPDRERRKEKRRWQKAKLHRDIIAKVEAQFQELEKKLRAGMAAAAGAPAFSVRVEGTGEEVLPVARHTLSRANFTRQKLVAETGDESAGRAACSFLNEAGFASDCVVESHVYSLVGEHVREDDVVLELGARYGAGTCAAAAAIGNSGKLVTVEPNVDVWAPLLWNRHAHHCSSWLFRGVVSDRDMAHSEGAQRGTSKLVAHGGGGGAAAAAAGGVATPHLTYTELQEATGLQFTAIIVDCVGCIDYLFRGNAAPLCELLQPVRVVILKGDVGSESPDCKHSCVDYSKWEALFAILGFALEEKKEAEFMPWLKTYVFVRFKTDQDCTDPRVAAAEEAAMAAPEEEEEEEEVAAQADEATSGPEEAAEPAAVAPQEAATTGGHAPLPLGGAEPAAPEVFLTRPAAATGRLERTSAASAAAEAEKARAGGPTTAPLGEDPLPNVAASIVPAFVASAQAPLSAAGGGAVPADAAPFSSAGGGKAAAASAT